MYILAVLIDKNHVILIYISADISRNSYPFDSPNNSNIKKIRKFSYLNEKVINSNPLVYIMLELSEA
jgi:hypothetical protein